MMTTPMTPMTPTTQVRSFAVAAFLIGLGYEPVGAAVSFGTPVYVFHEQDVAVGMRKYTRAKMRLDALTDEMQGEQGGPR